MRHVAGWAGLVVLCALAGTAWQAQLSAQPASATTDLERMPRNLEMRFALSALPPHLRAGATVYLLDPTRGYILGRKGTNGFSCIVERTEWLKVDFRNDIYTAVCYDSIGSTHHLRVWMDVATLRAQGITPGRLKAEIERRFRTKVYKAPTRAGLSYMVAPLMRTYPNPDPSDKTVATFSMPHFMFYAPNLTNRDIGGAAPPSPYPFIFEQGPHGYAILMVGESERAKIAGASKDLLKDLCAYRAFLCL